jgi:hypothetical protein
LSYRLSPSDQAQKNRLYQPVFLHPKKTYAPFTVFYELGKYISKSIT